MTPYQNRLHRYRILITVFFCRYLTRCEKCAILYYEQVHKKEGAHETDKKAMDMLDLHGYMALALFTFVTTTEQIPLPWRKATAQPP